MLVVVYVAHVDDDALYMGGTIAKLSKKHEVRIVYANNGVVVHGRKGGGMDYRHEARKISTRLGVAGFHFLNIPTMEFETYGQLELNKRFEKLGYKPDLILTHSEHDINEDHRIVFKSAQIQARCTEKSVRLLCCEPLQNPNFFVRLSKKAFRHKIAVLKEIDCEMRNFPHPRSYTSIEALAFVRGATCGCEYAEAFEVKRWVI
ncbi:MAG: PIG-L deacetylase family protein [Planctomycetota bacterium]|jgi:LmbE family N-acetylglucosaminyl deacetylase